MNETTKAAPRRASMPLFHRAFTGRGIDIGGGGDPLTAEMGFPGILSCENFDMTLGSGDAEQIHRMRPPESYDFVYSSQTLEDLDQPAKAFDRWLALVRPGGHLVITVPDFELYEGGTWPSQRNGAHRTCWGIGSLDTPAPYIDMIGFVQLARLRNDFRVMLLQLADTNYDYSRIGQGDQTLEGAEAFIELVVWKR